MLRPSAFSAFKTLLFALLLIAPLSGLETHQATNQDELFKLIGDYGNSIMTRGDEVIVAEGDYICGPCYSGVYNTMYFLYSLYGTVRCGGVLREPRGRGGVGPRLGPELRDGRRGVGRAGGHAGLLTPQELAPLPRGLDGVGLLASPEEVVDDARALVDDGGAARRAR